MARHRTCSTEFKRQVAREYIAGETLHALAKRHDLSRNLIRIWVAKFEAGAFEDEYSGCRSRNTKPRLLRWNAWWADERSRSSF